MIAIILYFIFYRCLPYVGHILGFISFLIYIFLILLLLFPQGYLIYFL